LTRSDRSMPPFRKPISPFTDAVNGEAMNTEIEVIKSKSVALRVAKELGLDKDPEFQPYSRFSALPERHRLSRLDSPLPVPKPGRIRTRRTPRN